MPQLDREKWNKRRSVYSSKYGNGCEKDKKLSRSVIKTVKWDAAAVFYTCMCMELGHHLLTKGKQKVYGRCSFHVKIVYIKKGKQLDLGMKPASSIKFCSEPSGDSKIDSKIHKININYLKASNNSTLVVIIVIITNNIALNFGKFSPYLPRSNPLC